MSSGTIPRACFLLAVATLMWTLSLLAVGTACGAEDIWRTPVNLGPVVNSSAGDWAPDISSDGLALFYEYGPGDTWMSTRESIGSPWSAPTNVGYPPNTEEYRDVAPTVSADMLTMYYFSTDTSNGKPDIWFVTRPTATSPWENPTALPANINTTAEERDPEISADGLMLLFDSDRAGGYGGHDLYACTRSSLEAPWSDPVNLGPNVNTSADERGPSIGSDGSVVYFHSNRAGGYGNYDIYLSRFIESEWTSAANAGPTVNSSSHDMTPEISANGGELFFSSDRPGGYGLFDVWVSTVIPEPATLPLIALAALGLFIGKRRSR